MPKKYFYRQKNYPITSLVKKYFIYFSPPGSLNPFFLDSPKS